MGILKFLLIAIGLYYLIGFLFRTIMPKLLKRLVNNLVNKSGQFINQEERYKEGEVHLDSSKKHNQKFDDKNVGEYVDYEEID